MPVIPRPRIEEPLSGPVGLRVLLLSQPTVAGTAVYVRQLAAHARAAGVDVTVASPSDGDLAAWCASDGVPWQRVDLRRAPGFDDLRHIRSLQALFASFDVVHLHSSKAGAVGRMARRGMGREAPAIVFTPHGWSWQVGGRARPVYTGIERLMLSSADAVVAVSDAERREGEEIFGTDRRLRTIPNGVDLRAFCPEGPVADRGPEPVISVVGRLCRQKGQDLALQVLAALPFPSARLRFIGSGEDGLALQAAADRLGIGARVDFLGTTNPAPHLRSSDVVLVPSRWDAFSLALVEAMACGAAVVATDVVGASALLAPADVVPEGDVGAMARRTAALLADPTMRATVGRRNAELAKEHPIERALDANLTLWARVSQERTAPVPSGREALFVPEQRNAAGRSTSRPQR